MLIDVNMVTMTQQIAYNKDSYNDMELSVGRSHEKALISSR